MTEYSLKGRTFVNETYSSYDDSRERKSFMKFFKEDNDFRRHVIEFFEIDTKVPYTFHNSDVYGVDYYVWTGVPGMSIEEFEPGKPNTFRIGMIEIEYKTYWHETWPINKYDPGTFTHLIRKMKFVEDELPYLQVMFNSSCTKLFTYSGDDIVRGRETGKRKLKNGMEDFFMEIPLSKAKCFGPWPKADLLMFKYAS